jgi:4-amino-4-deoxy-L-arabinose transferase-like glycosyltransferase
MNRSSGFFDRLLRDPLTWCSLFAVAIQFAYGLPSKCVTSDGERFIQQAKWLAAGDGYLGKEIWTFSGTGIRAETSLPPGYPVFLSGIMRLAGPGDRFLLVVRVVQILMSLGTCYLIYFAIRPRSKRLALLAFMILSLSFSSIYTPRIIMSETLSVFLIGLLCWSFSRMETRGGNSLTAFVQGLLCVASLMTAPATIFLVFGMWCYAFWRQRKQWRRLACLALGSLVLMAPWQLHCYRATGKVQPTIFKSIGVWQGGFTAWYRTWACKRADMLVFWEPAFFRELPDSIFSSQAQRDRLTALNERVADRDGFMLNHQTPDLDAAFGEAAAQRIADSPSRFYVVLPIVRAATLWFHCEEWNEILQMLDRFSFAKPIRTGKAPTDVALRTAIGILGVAAINVAPSALAIILLIGTARSIRRRQGLPLLILLSVLLYTVLSAVSGMGELRRDFAFYPAILFILFYLGRNSPAGESGAAPAASTVAILLASGQESP